MINASSLLVFAGRLHIVLLHMPIGIVSVLAAVEVFYKLRRRALDRSVRVLIACLAAAACVVTVATGLLLSREPEYGGSTLDLHKWLGIATGSVMLLAALAAARWVRVYGVLLAAAVILVVPTGHLGGSMVHGSDFLWAPFQPARRAGAGNGSNGGGAPVVKAPPDPLFESQVLPIFQARCMPCHSDAKHKGGLSLASLDAVLAGGEDGPVLDAAEPEKSDLMYRLRVEPSDEDHMPPKSKPQLTEQQISKIDEWVKSRAAKSPGAEPAPKESPAPAPEKPAASDTEKPKKETLAAPPPAAIEALRAQLVHVETIDPAQSLLWIDFGAAPKTDDALAARLLTPLSEWVRDLSVAGTQTGDETVKLAAGMPRLRKLNLSGTRVSAAGLEALKGAKGLEELTLTRTKLDDGAAGAIAAAPGLKRVFVWKSGIESAGVEALRKARPELVVETGEVEAHAAVETEPPIALSSDEPPPGGAAPAAAASLEPINDVCPVSGKPVNAKFAIVYEGKVIGFCCEKCAAQFWASPEKFAVKAK